MKNDLPLTKDLVLIGGGHTHALVLRMWGMKPLPGVRVTVINPAPTAPYSGMLPGFVAGHYTKDDLDIDLVKLARFAGARIILGRVTQIDREARTVTVPGRPPIPYDIASIDVGITTEMPELAGFADHGVPAKPLDTFAARWEAYRAKAKAPKIAVIGAGVAGGELAMAMAHALRGRKPRVRLIDRGTAFAQFNDRARALMVQSLADLGVELIENAEVAQVTSAGVELVNGTVIEAEFVTGVAGPRPHRWLSDLGLKTYDGSLSVGPTLVTSDPHLFAAGDCAYMAHAPRPKAGVFAVRQAPVLFHNLRAALSGGDLRGYFPQTDYLKLVSLGGQIAMAEKLGTAVKGSLLWQWKDRIDRKFMQKFKDLPVMANPKLPSQVASGVAEELGDAPLCGGCGAKVGRGALRDALTHLPQLDRADIQSVRGDDAAVIQGAEGWQVMTTDHLRAFTNDPRLMTQLAAVHALGDIWAMGAAPSLATVSVILPRMSKELQRRTMAEVTEAAAQVMETAGAAIVGGHSSIGSEFTVGFTLIGTSPTRPITLAGGQPGDALILTKPIGSGVLMAGEMRGQAKGSDVAEAYRQMSQPQAIASRILTPVARAMTDVTGFGLAGHLDGICEASGTGAELELAQIPTLKGAEDLAKLGVRSTIWADNRGGIPLVTGPQGPRFDLLFDPQTAGGLLAVVPAHLAQETVDALKLAGYPAATIGHLTEAEGIRAR